MSDQVECSIKVKYRTAGKEAPQDAGIHKIYLPDEGGFPKLVTSVQDVLKQEGAQGKVGVKENHALYLRHGTYSVHYRKGLDLESWCLNDISDWSHCTQLRRRAENDRPNEAAEVKIKVEFSSVLTVVTPVQEPLKFLTKQLASKDFASQLPNRAEFDYIPTVDFNEVVTKASVTAVIQKRRSCMSWSMDQLSEFAQTEAENRFVAKVFDKARILFAILFLLADGMECLESLVNEGASDDDIPNLAKRFPEHPNSDLFKYIIDHHWRFQPHDFGSLNSESYFELQPFEILPISVVKRIGGGGHGQVYQVNLERSLQRFKKHRKGDLALKCFFREREGKDFIREKTFLNEFETSPHPHICAHICAWTQGNHGYILFPLAKMDLRTFLINEAQPRLTREMALWLLRQITGLAGAINHIHNPAPPAGNKDLSSNATKRQGYHHDIKPENMLVYYRLDTYIAGDIKLTDFGKGKMNDVPGGSRTSRAIVSHQSHSQIGTLTYASPDHDLNGTTSRPDDMWAIGCVVTELLEWVFLKPKEGEKSFQSARVAPMSDDSDMYSDCFWTRGEDRRMMLKPQVLSWLDLVRANEACKDEFEQIVDLAKGLLEINRERRIKANDFDKRMKELLASAEIRLANQPDYFANNIAESSNITESSTVRNSLHPSSAVQTPRRHVQLAAFSVTSPQNLTKRSTPPPKIRVHSPPQELHNSLIKETRSIEDHTRDGHRHRLESENPDRAPQDDLLLQAVVAESSNSEESGAFQHRL